MVFSEEFKIGTKQQLMDLIDEVGFVPFFINEIEGLSLETSMAGASRNIQRRRSSSERNSQMRSISGHRRNPMKES